MSVIGPALMSLAEVVVQKGMTGYDDHLAVAAAQGDKAQSHAQKDFVRMVQNLQQAVAGLAREAVSGVIDKARAADLAG